MLRTYRYEEIADDLREQIENGTFTDTKRLPSERNLMLRYAVQRDTIRRALSLLEAEGRIITHQKRGSFVIPSTEQRETAFSDQKTASAGTILVVTPRNDSSTALESLLRGLGAILATSGHAIGYFDSQPLPGRITQELPSLEFLRENNIVGIALWPHSTADAAELEQLRTHLPLVLIDRRIPGFTADIVGFDNAAGGEKVTEHLISLGHRRIGFLGDEVFAETVQQRWRGYATALEAAGLTAHASDFLFFNGVTDEAFQTYLQPYLQGFGRPPLSAVVCSNDNTALRLLRYLRSVGQDLAVTGYGDLLPNYLGAMGLTTVSQPFEDLGRAVGNLLLRRLSNTGGSATRFQQIDLPAYLIVRGSTAPL